METVQEIEKQKQYIEKVKEINQGKELKYVILTMGCQLNENDSEKLKGMVDIGNSKDYTILYNVEADTDKVSTISIKLSDSILNPKKIYMFSFDYQDLKKAIERIEKGE